MNFTDRLETDFHVGYVVENVEQTLECLQKTWNCCETVSCYNFSPMRAWTCGMPLEDLTLRIAQCTIKEGMTLEIIQPVTKAGFHFLSLVANGDNLNHVAFKTTEYDSCHKDFLARGATFVFEAETNDRENGYRRCLYATFPGLPGIYEVLEKATAYRPEL